VEAEGNPTWATSRSSVWGNPSALGLEWQQEVEMDIAVDAKAEGDAHTPFQGCVVGAIARGQPMGERPDTDDRLLIKGHIKA